VSGENSLWVETDTLVDSWVMSLFFFTSVGYVALNGRVIVNDKSKDMKGNSLGILMYYPSIFKLQTEENH
jgi:hypothetical protein